MLFLQFRKSSKQTKETLVVQSVFGIVIGGWIGQLKFFKRNLTKDVFDNFTKLSFFQHPLNI